jgi:uncharacterized UPF0146 family protein
MYKDVAKNIDVFKIEYPNTIVPKPNSENYENGFIRRYFIRQTNDINGHIFEISNELYSNYLENPLTANDLKVLLKKITILYKGLNGDG